MSEAAAAPDGEKANDGKQLVIEVDGARYQRIPIKTPLVVVGDDLLAIVRDNTAGKLLSGDRLFVTEKIVAITQGRSYPISEVHPRPLATFLAKYVTKTSFGIGIGMPETMEMALREAGTPRILFAAAVAAVTKTVLRRTGDFYRVAGSRVRGIDGPTAHTIPPYNEQVVLVPLRPRQVAREIQAVLDVPVDVLVVDINDLGGNILGSTLTRAEEDRVRRILKDNPLGQRHESTPLGVIRAAG